MKSWLLISGMAAFSWGIMLQGAPDPDLFDGRVSGGSDSLSAGEATGKEGEGSDEDSGGGGADAHSEGVEHGEGSSESSVEATAENTVETKGKSAGSGHSAQGSSSADATPTDSGRSFEAFEVGAVDGKNVPIDVNRSKEFSSESEAVPGAVSQNTHSDAQNSDQNAQKSGSGNQESYDGQGSADYGTSVPSGL